MANELNQETEDTALRRSVLLSIQRAMTQEIGPDLRAIFCSWSASEINIRAIYDGEISAQDLESLNLIATEALADFGPPMEIRARPIRVDAPRHITAEPTETCVYMRREANITGA